MYENPSRSCTADSDETNSIHLLTVRNSDDGAAGPPSLCEDRSLELRAVRMQLFIQTIEWCQVLRVASEPEPIGNEEV